MRKTNPALPSRVIWWVITEAFAVNKMRETLSRKTGGLILLHPVAVWVKGSAGGEANVSGRTEVGDWYQEKIKVLIGKSCVWSRISLECLQQCKTKHAGIAKQSTFDLDVQAKVSACSIWFDLGLFFICSAVGLGRCLGITQRRLMVLISTQYLLKNFIFRK